MWLCADPSGTNRAILCQGTPDWDGLTAFSGYLEDKTGSSFPRCGWEIEKVMIYQFIPVMSGVVETSLKIFLHLLRSVVIDKVAEANAKAMTATSIEMRRILTDRQSFGRFGG